MGALKRTQLASREKAINAAMEAAKEHFAVIGTHLRAIRDDELYKEEFETFEAYVADRWDYSRAYAYRLISAAKVIENLSTNVDIELPKTEGQTQAIAEASNDPEVQKEVWTAAQEAAGTDQPAAVAVRKTAEIVITAKPVNHESLEIDSALTQFERLHKKLEECGKRIQTAVAAKIAVCKAMQSRQVKFEKRISNMAAPVSMVGEHIDGLIEEWERTKKQVDE